MLVEIKPERRLYPMVMRWLNLGFATSEALMNEGQRPTLFSADVSTKKAEVGGHWSRPDLATIAYRRGIFTPAWEASIYSFEVKCQSTVNQAAVYEAVAHTRFVHYSYLMWQEEDMPSPEKWQIVDLCREFGVGAITASDPKDENTYRLRAKPKRNQITISDTDGFIRERFPFEKQKEIKDWLSMSGWKQLGEGQDTI